MKFNLDIPKMGYIIMVRNAGGWFGNSIEKQQLKAGFNKDHARYTHVEISGGGETSVRIAPPKTKIIDITKKYKGRFIRIVRLKNIEYEEKKRYKIAFWAASLCNLRYDYLGVGGFIVKWLRKHNRLFFCSEGCLWTLRKFDPFVLAGMTPDECMPADFNNPEYFEKVWEGIIE